MIIKSEPTTQKDIHGDKEPASKNTYRCTWPNCGHEFTRVVRKRETKNLYDKGHQNISPQIECPRCGNGLKTWPEDNNGKV